jgi:hypothetical protein
VGTAFEQLKANYGGRPGSVFDEMRPVEDDAS